MRQPVFVLLFSLTLLGAAGAAAAQKFQPKSIEFKGDPEYTDQELMDAAGLKLGAVLTSAEMNDHSKLLMDSGVFNGLTYKFDGLNLVFSLVPADQMYPIRLENLPLTVTGKDLDAKLHERLPLYHGKVPSEGTLLDSVRAALVEMLAAQGINATVTAIPAGNQQTKKVDMMAFSISSPEVHPAIARIEGLAPPFEDKVEGLLANAAKGPYNTSRTAPFLQQGVEFFFEEQGYAAAKVTAERAGPASVTPDGVLVPYAVKVDPGKLYNLGAIHLPADSLVTQAEIDKVTATQATLAKGITVRSIWEMIYDRYKSKGYMSFKLTPHPQFDEAAGTVNYTLDFEPGPVYHLAMVRFDNVSDDLRHLLMRNWQMLPGDVFDNSYVTRFVLDSEKADPALRRTLETVKANYDMRLDPETHEVNLVIRLEKRQ